MVPLTVGIIVIITLLSGCNNCPECPPASTTTTTTPAAAPTTAPFHHLRLGKDTVVSLLSLSSSDFKKLVMGFRVNDYNHFPDSLTMVGYAAKNSGDVTVNQPYVLSILPETKSLTTDLTLSTQELSRVKLVNLVGPAGTSVTYNYLEFIPYVKDSVGKKFLAYRVEFRPRPGGGTSGSEETNPCPPFKPE